MTVFPDITFLAAGPRVNAVVGPIVNKMKKYLIIIAVVLLSAAAWTWYDLQNKPANERIRAGIQTILAREPRVKPIYDDAMSDGVLTLLEANRIVDKANEFKGK